MPGRNCILPFRNVNIKDSTSCGACEAKVDKAENVAIRPCSCVRERTIATIHRHGELPFGWLLVNGIEPPERLFTEIAWIIEAAVAIEGTDALHFRIGKLEVANAQVLD